MHGEKWFGARIRRMPGKWPRRMCLQVCSPRPGESRMMIFEGYFSDSPWMNTQQDYRIKHVYAIFHKILKYWYVVCVFRMMKGDVVTMKNSKVAGHIQLLPKHGWSKMSKPPRCRTSCGFVEALRPLQPGTKAMISEQWPDLPCRVSTT